MGCQCSVLDCGWLVGWEREGVADNKEQRWGGGDRQNRGRSWQATEEPKLLKYKAALLVQKRVTLTKNSAHVEL